MLLLSMLLIGSSSALAQEPAVLAATVEAPVQVDVTLVLASDNGIVDPELRALKGELGMLRYTGYQLVRTESARLVAGGTLEVQLMDGQELQLRLVGHDDRSAKLRIRRVRGDEVLAEQTVNVHRDRALVSGGQRVAEGHLLHPITVSW